MARYPIAKPIAGGYVDELLVELTGRCQLRGWTRGKCPPPVEVCFDDEVAPLREWFRFRRDDVARAMGGDDWAGFVLGYAAERPVRQVALRAGNEELARVEVSLAPVAPHYAALFDTETVLHREHMYGYGPPSSSADASVVSLARSLPGPLLDLGCGSGALVRALRESGTDARGIEIDRPEIAQSLAADLQPFITLYRGELPLPFRDGEFASVTCVEVLEHIPDWRAALAEMARVARHALITVPDASAIPTLFPHHVIPWHMLEATHVNFFTQASLAAALAPVFRGVSFLRIQCFEINGTPAYTSLVARCER